MSIAPLAVGLFVAVQCHGVTAGDLRAMYGHPAMQRFAAGKDLQVSVEYSQQGHVTKVEIANAKHSMDRSEVAAAIEYFVPTAWQKPMLNGLNCLGGAKSMSCGMTQDDGEISIQRIFISMEKGEERESEATITSKSGLPQTETDVEFRFGAPSAERFLPAAGIGLMATYDPGRVATEMSIAPVAPRDESGLSSMMSAFEAERVLALIAPATTRWGDPALASASMGCNEMLISEFENVRITHQFHHCRLPEVDLITEIRVTFKPR